MPEATLVERVARLIQQARAAVAGTDIEAELVGLERRLDEPLRVAVAGRVKAGKSTLLNALVGEELAPTDAAECTRVVTWYQDGLTYRVTIDPNEGPSTPARFTRHAGVLEVDLEGRDPDTIRRLVVEWPSSSLRQMTIIDTPGVDAASRDSDVALSVLAGPWPSDRPADAVIYLMRHLHPTDARFLESFRDRDHGEPTPVNAIAVLSRADELGVGRPDALQMAGRIAERYQQDPSVRRLCQAVVPVAGLLGQAAATLREDEFRAIGRVASLPADELDNLMLSADRFAHRRTSALLAESERAYLVERLGLFGARLAVELVRHGVSSAPQLSAELMRHSGVPRLREQLAVRFSARRDLLKARAVLMALEALLPRLPQPVAGRLAGAVEEVEAGAHELTELATLNALWTGGAGVPEDWVDEADRVLGGRGADLPTRLGLAADAAADEVNEQLTSTHARWQRRAEHPLSTRSAAEVARVVVRTCEGMVAARPQVTAATGGME